MRKTMLLVLVGTVSAPALARPDERVTIIVQTSSPVVLPGQSVGVSVYAAYSPGIGSIAIWNTLGGTGQACTVQQMGNALFNMAGTLSPGTSGAWSNLALGPNLQPPPGGYSGTIAGANVNNINAGSGFQPAGGNNIANPCLLWSGTWTFDPSSGPGIAQFASFVVGVPGAPNRVTMLLDSGGHGFAKEDAWTTTNGQAVIQVIPSPASLALLGLGGLVAGRRRRIVLDSPNRRTREGEPA